MTPRDLSRHFARISFAMLALVAASLASAQTTDKKNEGPWQVSAGLGLVSTPEYEGSSKNVTGVAPDLNIGYKTKDWGTFAIGSKARGISWTALDTEAYSLGVSLGASNGRQDTKDGTLLKPGSKRLKGMGEIKSGAEYGVFGHVTLGVPLTFAVIKGAGDGKTNAVTGTIKGHGGSRIELGAEIPWQVNSSLGLSFAPNIVWADKKYNQAYFGVTNAQSANSGFKAYTAGAGVKSIGLAVGANYKFDANWSANAAVSFNQFRGDAANSPLAQKKAQNTLAAGVAYTF
jgi:MipA family protein